MMDGIKRTVFVLGAIYSPEAAALEGNFGIDFGLASTSRAHADSIAPVRWMPSTMSLTPRAHLDAGAYLYPSLNWGVSVGGVDSSMGPVALGLLYHRENLQSGLDPSLLPGWKLPGEEIEELSIHSLVGLGTAVSFLNRSLSLGMSGFYIGTSSDLNVMTHAFELNLSGGAKFADQLILGIGFSDLLQQSEGRSIQGAFRWGALDISGPIWQRCPSMADVYYTSGGVEVDAGYSLDNGAVSFVGVSGDIPLHCNVSIRGGVENRFIEEQTRYAFGVSYENIVQSIGYDVQLRNTAGTWEHVHLISFHMRLSDAPFQPKPHI